MFNNNKYIPVWRTWVVHTVAALVGIKVHIHGMPYGSRDDRYAPATETSIQD